MKPWWQVAIPHKDIREGRFDPSLFAIDLGEVVYGQGAQEYRDPIRFFTRTYMTNGLKELILKVLTTLYKEEVKTELKQISPVTQLVTPFGGGKTHSLLALYHITKNYHDLRFIDEVKTLLESVGLEEIPETNVASIDGTHLDPLKGTNVASIDGTHLDPLKGSVKPEGMNIKTLWGELAYQLGGAELYETVKEHDEKMVSPGKERIKSFLKASSPCLLILDEILGYVVKARGVQVHRTNLGGQTMAFMQELTGAVAALADEK
jgi:Predicted ATPase (AAA+ superfamily)